ncbi:MAG: DNA polymerase III subunit gamma/tau [Sulfurospirillum sp.]|nr:DNA polymerase III subunit gamma/tau [Sulfurospirillum sp.]
MLFEVLARKYRPNSFDKLIGQDAITQTLSLALDQNRLSHAYLFSGLRGSGKTSTARIFAKALVCDNSPTSTPCEVCPNCMMANENRHIDIIEMDGASNRGIDDIRDLVEQTKYRPNTAKFKIFIIDEVHMLTPQAFNALLKTLEEPPAYVKFILATTDPLKLPATILSRTQHFRFKQISKPDIIHHLSHLLHLEKIEYEPDALEMLARAGNGSLRDTLTLLDQAIIFSKSFVTPKSVATMLGFLDPATVQYIFEVILKKDKKALLQLLKKLEEFECEAIIDALIAYLKDAFYEQDNRFSTLLYERFFRILSESKSLLFLNADNGFVLALVFFKMIEAMQIKTIEELVDSLESEKFRVVGTTDATVQKDAAKPSHVTSTQTTTTPAKEINLFDKLIAMIEDRSFELAEVFKKNVSFISFEEDTLTWSLKANDDDKKKLRHGYNIIKQFVQEIYGINTAIKVRQEDVNDITPADTIASPQEPIMSGGDSCIAGRIGKDAIEAEAKEIIESDLFRKAQEMFQVKDIKIYPKI